MQSLQNGKGDVNVSMESSTLDVIENHVKIAQGKCFVDEISFHFVHEFFFLNPTNDAM